MSESLLIKIFSNHEIYTGIGSGDSLDFHYIDITRANKKMMSIISFINSDKQGYPRLIPIDLLEVESPMIEDSYGLKVGNSYAEVRQKRGVLSIMDMHHYKALGALEGRPIYYSIYGETDPIYYTNEAVEIAMDVSVEDILDEEVIKNNWVIFKITWPSPAW